MNTELGCPKTCSALDRQSPTCCTSIPQTVSRLGQPKNQADLGYSAEGGLDRLGSELQLVEKQLSAVSTRIPARTRQLADCSECSHCS